MSRQVCASHRHPFWHPAQVSCPTLHAAAATCCHLFCLQKQAHEHEEALTSKTQERDLHEQTVASTRSQVTSLHEQREVAAQEAAAAQALIRDKADAAKVERERWAVWLVYCPTPRCAQGDVIHRPPQQRTQEHCLSMMSCDRAEGHCCVASQTLSTWQIGCDAHPATQLHVFAGVAAVIPRSLSWHSPSPHDRRCPLVSSALCHSLSAPVFPRECCRPALPAMYSLRRRPCPFPFLCPSCHLSTVPPPCRALQQKARVDQALTELDEQRAAHMKQDSELQEARAVAEKNAANIQPVRWYHFAAFMLIWLCLIWEWPPRSQHFHRARAVQLQGGSCDCMS